MSNILAKTAILLSLISIHFLNYATGEVTDTVSVTASRTSTNLMSSGTSFSVLDRQAIVNSNANSLVYLDYRSISKVAVALLRRYGCEAQRRIKFSS